MSANNKVPTYEIAAGRQRADRSGVLTTKHLVIEKDDPSVEGAGIGMVIERQQTPESEVVITAVRFRNYDLNCEIPVVYFGASVDTAAAAVIQAHTANLPHAQRRSATPGETPGIAAMFRL